MSTGEYIVLACTAIFICSIAKDAYKMHLDSVYRRQALESEIQALDNKVNQIKESVGYLENNEDGIPF